MKLSIQRLDPDLPLPSYAHEGDAGLDLLSAENITLGPGERAAVPTGIAVAIEEGFAGFVVPRSGRALKEGLSIANAPGLIDAGYRGEVKVVVVNLDSVEKIVINRGDKIAQLVIQEVVSVELEESQGLPASERGRGGFGSTGR
jgi:dUTP pyrophosphatase